MAKRVFKPTVSPEEFGDLIDSFTKGFPEVVANAMFAANQQLVGATGGGDIPDRIHNIKGTKDIKGKTRKYKSNWKKVRADPKKYGYSEVEARQTKVVDHTFTGDLQSSYEVVRTQKSVDSIIVGEANIKKIKGNEKQYSNPVWEASKREEKRAVEVFNEQLVLYVNKFF